MPARRSQHRVDAGISHTWTAELALLARLARLAPTEADVARARAMAAGAVDWERLLRLAEYHGVAPLVHRNLDRLSDLAVPAHVAERLRQMRLSLIRGDLALQAAWLELCAAFDACGLPALTLKGFHVVRSIYGDVGLRPVGDLDFLVRPGDVARALTLLEQRGYRLFPDWARAIRHVGLAHILKRSTEMGLVSDRGAVVDLHWEAGPRGTAPSTDVLLARAERFAVDGCMVLVPAPSAAMALLALHGQTSRWGRLRWLVDIAEGLDRLSPGGLDDAIDHLDVPALRPALANALALIDSLWGGLPQGGRALGSAGNARHQRLLRHAVRGLEQTRDPMQMFDVWRPLRMTRDRLGRVPSITGAFAWAARPNHFDWAAVALPRPLRVGYYGVRPMRLLRQAALARRAGAPPQPAPSGGEPPSVGAIRDLEWDYRPGDAAAAPLTFVSAIYTSGPAALLGGRGRGVAHYLPSLINIGRMGAPIVMYCAEQDAAAIERAIMPHFSACRVVPFALGDFEHFAEFLEWKRAYRDTLQLNDRNEVLCFLKSYWLQDAIARDPFGHDRYFWIDAGLTHHGIFPERLGGVELLTKVPASRYYPQNQANIFTPDLAAALARAPAPGTTLFCALPFHESRRGAYERAGAALFGRAPEEVRIQHHLVGGIFGGYRADVRPVHERYAALLAELIRTRTYTLEEQVFSTVNAVYPELFSLRRFGTWWFHSPGERTSYLDADGDSFFKIFTGLVHELRANRASTL